MAGRGGAYLVRLAVRGGLWRERVLGSRAHAHGHPSGREGRRHGDRCGTLVLGLPTRSCTRREREVYARTGLRHSVSRASSMVRPAAVGLPPSIHSLGASHGTGRASSLPTLKGNDSRRSGR